MLKELTLNNSTCPCILFPVEFIRKLVQVFLILLQPYSIGLIFSVLHVIHFACDLGFCFVNTFTFEWNTWGSSAPTGRIPEDDQRISHPDHSKVWEPIVNNFDVR